MPRVTFITFAGERHPVDATSGLSLMRAAVDHDVPGIDADCGGQCACATCHVYIAPPWTELTGARNARENEMLNFVEGLRETSRLACQIPVTDAMDGIEVGLPEAQH